ncbi:MAG: heavy-metal-associated domain-containing protein, partial [Microcystaceae cyanobacterium]
MVQLSLPSPTVALPSPLTTVTLDVQGMKCAGCVSAVERQLKQQPGVQSAQVNLVTAIAVVQYAGE